jgi:hypothetical protein
MYNVFKRPMFKLGGQADQGSGIMSHVEPRQNYMFGNVAQPLTPFQTAYADLPIQGYAMGGRIGYAQAGPVMPGTLPGAGFNIPSLFQRLQDQNVEPTTVSSDATGINSLAQRRLDKLRGMPSFNPVKPITDYYKGNQALDSILMQEGLINEKSTLPEITRARKDYRVKLDQGKSEMELGLDKESGDFATGIGGQNTEVRKPTKKETVDTDPRNKIREEADMLKGLLKDEGLTTAENALLIARALATPGGINAKIAAAGEMALPLLRDRAKLDKEAVLKAYERTGELEKARITAGALTNQQKLIRDDVEITKQRAIQEGKAVVGPDGITRYNGLTEAEIRQRVMAPIFGKYTTKELDAKIIETRKLEEKINQELAKPKPDQKVISNLQEKININKELYKFATGGRVNKAAGGMSITDTTVGDTTDGTTQQSETIVDTNVDNVPMKPVQKLSFEEIRNRLPKEITDDIVRLIANSSEALQDFAYIKTQQDVNQFNVKYGVNLVLPQNA